MDKKLWHGRFSGQTSPAADSFNSSLSFDKRLYKYDILGSIAHCTMLQKCGIINDIEKTEIINGLNKLLDEIENGKSIENAEDIHSFVENELTKSIGKSGEKLHTARSRNDQVALDFRMYIRDRIDALKHTLIELITVIIKHSEQNLETYMTGFTHLQHAQPTTLAHYLMAYANMFERDIDRLTDCKKRVNVLPLGSCAMATTTLPIDRETVKTLLGFDNVCENSIDGVSDRDFAVEYLAVLSLIMTHLSRMSEELILWSTTEFKFCEISDKFSTGSSIMPQKKNADMLELIRGKTGRVNGGLIALLTTLKGLPLAYNKDMQEDKESVFDAEDTCFACLNIMIPMLDEIIFNKQNLFGSALRGYSAATDIADYLVKKSVPFRQAHAIVGSIVRYCIENNKNLEVLTLLEYLRFSDQFDDTIFTAIKLENIINNRNIIGGPAKSAVQNNINNLKSKLKI